MGCRCSSSVKVETFLDKKAHMELTDLGVSLDDFRVLLRFFDEADILKQRKPTIDDICACCRIDSDRGYVASVFDQIEREGSWISARELVICMWIFLRLDSRGLGQFAFDTIVPRRSKIDYLTWDQLHELVVHADGSSGADTKTKALVEGLYGNAFQKEISLAKFMEATHTSPSLLRPVMQAQTRLRQKLGGVAFWTKRPYLSLEEPKLKAMLERKQNDTSSKRRVSISPNCKGVDAKVSSDRSVSKSRRGSVQMPSNVRGLGDPASSKAGRRKSVVTAVGGAEDPAVSEVYQYKPAAASGKGVSSRKKSSNV